MIRTVATLLLLGLLAAARVDAATDVYFQAVVTDPRVDEISGFAASHRHPGVVWTHNDSGDKARIFALDATGKVLAEVGIRGARNVDWEDLARFRRDGKDYLMIADTGDNGGVRRELTLYVIEEPAELVDQRVRLAWKMKFRWPDGPRDCEAVAVDHETGEIYLISKKRAPPELFRLPARPNPPTLEIAERVGFLQGIEQPTPADLERNPVYGRYRSQITAADISPDNRRMAVLNYRRLMVYDREEGQTWAEATARSPHVVEFPWMPQAEAVSFTADGTEILIGSERLPAPIIRIPAP